MPKVDIGVGELVDMINRGELRLPELQRRYVWPATRVRDLLDSLYRGYPSGTILVWETDLDVPARDLSIEQQRGAFGSQKLLLDGQQRLTSLSAVLRGEPLRLKNRVRPVEIAFNLDHPEGPPTDVIEVDDDATPDLAIADLDAGSSDDVDTPIATVEGAADAGNDNADVRSVQERVKNFTFVVAWKALLADPKWVKVSDIFNPQITDWELLKPLAITPDEDVYDRYAKRLQRVRQIRQYPYVMQVLERDLSYEEVAEIFVRVNSLGMKLRGSDLALAQITAKWPNSLDLFEAFAEECERNWWFTFDLGLLVRTLVVFASGQSRFRSVGGISLATLQGSWERAKTGLRFAVNFLKTNAGIEDESLLSSPFVIIPIAVLGVLRDEQLSPQEERDLLHWLFVANATGHYSRGSSETLLDADLSLLFRRGGSAHDLVEIVKQQFGRIRFTAADFAGRNSRNPLFSTAYLALKKVGAQDWRSGLGLSLTHAGRAHYVQAHHVFPKSVMVKLGYDSREINEIANLAFISGSQNRSLGKRTPDEYFPEIVTARGAEALLRQGIPNDPELWNPDRFLEFLEYRRAELAGIINGFLDEASAGSDDASIDLQSLIQTDENDHIEFKETARVNIRTGAVDKEIEHSVVKTIAAFMNAGGGTLVIGVHDGSGELRGLDLDIRTLGRKDIDGYEQFLRQLLNTVLGAENSSRIAISFPAVDGNTACVVRVPRSPRAVYARNGTDAHFFIRDGNTTRRLNSEETVRYCADRFGQSG
jgi:hypothetical protein